MATLSNATLRAYRTDWLTFAAWCKEHRRRALPATPQTVASFLEDESNRCSYSTVSRRRCAIRYQHRLKAEEDPTDSIVVRRAMDGLHRVWKGPEQKDPLLISDVRAVIRALRGTELIQVRDRALLLVGFAGAFRRSELVGLDVDDVIDDPLQLVALCRQTGRKVGIPYGSNPETCPVQAYRAWIEAAGISDGPIFRPLDRHGNVRPVRLSGKAVALIVKRAAAAAGLDPAVYAGHSLRSGLATSARALGRSDADIIAQTGHVSGASLNAGTVRAAFLPTGPGLDVGL